MTAVSDISSSLKSNLQLASVENVPVAVFHFSWVIFFVLNFSVYLAVIDDAKAPESSNSFEMTHFSLPGLESTLEKSVGTKSTGGSPSVHLRSIDWPVKWSQQKQFSFSSIDSFSM